MKFYAYIPTNDRREPMGTENRILFDLKTIRGAINHCNKQLGENTYVLFSYTNIYNDNTFKCLVDCNKHFPENLPLTQSSFYQYRKNWFTS
jgi:hypothetical protein